MNRRLLGWSLLVALVYGPVLFALLILLHLNETGFSFSTHVVCNLAAGGTRYRLLFGFAAWGMALLHIPFLVKWPAIAVKEGGTQTGKLLFFIAGVLFVAGFLLFPVFVLDPQTLTSYRVHQVIASFYFPACAVIAIVPWINLRGGGGSKPLLTLVSWTWMVTALAFAVSFIALASTAPPYPGWVNLLQWVFLVAYGLWALVYGLTLIGVLRFR